MHLHQDFVILLHSAYPDGVSAILGASLPNLFSLVNAFNDIPPKSLSLSYGMNCLPNAKQPDAAIIGFFNVLSQI